MLVCMKKIVPMALPVDTTWMKMATIRMLVPRWMIQIPPLELLVMLACIIMNVPKASYAKHTRMKVATGRVLVAGLELLMKLAQFQKIVLMTSAV